LRFFPPFYIGPESLSYFRLPYLPGLAGRIFRRFLFFFLLHFVDEISPLFPFLPLGTFVFSCWEKSTFSQNVFLRPPHQKSSGPLPSRTKRAIQTTGPFFSFSFPLRTCGHAPRPGQISGLHLFFFPRWSTTASTRLFFFFLLFSPQSFPVLTHGQDDWTFFFSFREGFFVSGISFPRS